MKRACRPVFSPRGVTGCRARQFAESVARRLTRSKDSGSGFREHGAVRRARVSPPKRMTRSGPARQCGAIQRGTRPHEVRRHEATLHEATRDVVLRRAVLRRDCEQGNGYHHHRRRTCRLYKRKGHLLGAAKNRIQLRVGNANDLAYHRTRCPATPLAHSLLAPLGTVIANAGTLADQLQATTTHMHFAPNRILGSDGARRPSHMVTAHSSFSRGLA